MGQAGCIGDNGGAPLAVQIVLSHQGGGVELFHHGRRHRGGQCRAGQTQASWMYQPGQDAVRVSSGSEV